MLSVLETATGASFGQIIQDAPLKLEPPLITGNSDSHGENAFGGRVDGILCLGGVPEGMRQLPAAVHLNAVYPP